MRRKRSRSSRRGVTLIEVLVVLVIVAAMASLVSISVLRSKAQADIDNARIQIHQLRDAVTLHHLRHNEWPTSLEVLAGKELDRVPRDPWGTPYVYTTSNDSFDVRSCGPDRVPGGGDDVVPE
jgi:general secretion pathway protein G